MKHIKIAILPLIFICLFLFYCKEEKSKVKNAQASSFEDKSSYSSKVDNSNKNFDSLLILLINMQTKILQSGNINNINSLNELYKISYDSLSGCFYVAGKGIANKSLPLSSQKMAQEKAALMDANRWALYLKSAGMNIQIDKEISGDITYSKLIIEKLMQDTLFRLYLIPFGSIILKKKV
jgi:hypothetical protein